MFMKLATPHKWNLKDYTDLRKQKLNVNVINTLVG